VEGRENGDIEIDIGNILRSSRRDDSWVGVDVIRMDERLDNAVVGLIRWLMRKWYSWSAADLVIYLTTLRLVVVVVVVAMSIGQIQTLISVCPTHPL
jgi:hypothetical protein